MAVSPLDPSFPIRYLDRMDTSSTTRATVYLIDVSSFIFRAYYSIGYLSRRDGTPTGAVFGVANMLVSLLDEYSPSHIAVAMDSKTPTFRKEIFPEYKANRPPPPEDLKEQFPLVAELLEGFDLPVLQRDGFEADDVIATAARVAREAGLEVVILTGDKDLMQLVGPGVTVLDTMKKKVWDAAAVEEKWGVPPALLGDLLALAGDSSDNIPGVPRVGPKTAAPLLMEHGGLDQLLENRSALKSKAMAKRLEEHEADARLSRKLVALREDVPLDVTVEGMVYRPPEPAKLARTLDHFEFTQLKKRLLGDFEEEPETYDTDYRTSTDAGELASFAEAIRAAGRFAVDLETTSIDPVRAEIVGVALSWKPGTAVYLPVAHREADNLDLDVVLGVLGPLLEDPAIGVVAQNVKYEDILFRRHGIRIANVAFDPMLASYLIRPEDRRHGLDVIAKEVLNRRMISYDDVTEKQQGKQLSFDAVTLGAATEYAGEDADVALSVAEEMAPMVEAAGADRLLHEMEIPLARVLAGMELKGVMLDSAVLVEMSGTLGKRLDELEKEAHEMAGFPFNLSSTKQLRELLFDKLGLPPQSKTKTGYSTNAEVLEALAPLHPLPALLVEHRILTKLKNTYLDALPKLVNPTTSRIHTSFNQAVAATGRLSSSDPNLQNIPIRRDLGREIRRAFVAAPGHLLVSADYSQVELRVLAHLSDDPVLVSAFRNGEDIHARTARAIFAIPADQEVPADARSKAKAVNFGVIYGKTAFSLGKELGISRGEAQRFIDEYFNLHEGVKRFMDETIENAKKTRRVETLFGRRRELRDIISRNFNVRSGAERMARNTPIQGTAADLLKVAMIKVDQRLTAEKSPAAMILTVHDELVFEVPEEAAEATIPLIREEMEGAVALSVPLTVDVGTGRTWADAH